MITGIDTSKHTDNYKTALTVDWQKCKAAGCRFIIMRATIGLDKDVIYDLHKKDLEGVLPRGSYHYYRTTAGIIAQVKFYRQTAGVLEIAPVMDLEDWYKELPKGQPLIDIATNFLNECDQQFGQETILYTSPNIIKYYLQIGAGHPLTKRQLWVAHYGVVKPAIAPWTDYVLHQYSETVDREGHDGRFYGFTESTAADMNEFNGDENKFKLFTSGKEIKPMADTRSRMMFSNSGDAVPTTAQLAGKSALVIKGNRDALNNFAFKVDAGVAAKVATGLFWEADLWFYSDQGFSQTDKTKWTPPANDPQFQLMDRFVNNHTLQFAIVDMTVTTRIEDNQTKQIDAGWLIASGNHILSTMQKRYPKLKKIYLYIKKDTVQVEYTGENKTKIGDWVAANKDLFPLAFPDNSVSQTSGGLPKNIPWQNNNPWHWWLAYFPFEFVYAWGKDAEGDDQFHKAIGFTPGAVTPDPDPVDPPVTPLPGTDSAKLDAILAILTKHFK